MKAAINESKFYQQENEKLKTENDKLIHENARLKVYPTASASTETAQSAAKIGDSTPSATASPQISVNPNPAQLQPRIHFETGSAAGVSYAKKLGERLREKGFVVQSPTSVSEGDLGYSEVKYYFPEDSSGAALLIRTLRDLGVGNLLTEPRQVVAPRDTRPGHLDVWIDPPHMGQDTKR